METKKKDVIVVQQQNIPPPAVKKTKVNFIQKNIQKVRQMGKQTKSTEKGATENEAKIKDASVKERDIKRLGNVLRPKNN